VLVEEGTLRCGDLVVAGEAYGKLRAMQGDKGQNITEAPPSTPVELLGLDGVPDAGEIFNVVTDEKSAKALVEHRREQRKRKEASSNTRVSLENILEKIKLGEVKEVRIVLKADVQRFGRGHFHALRNLSTPTVGRERDRRWRGRHHRVRRDPGQGLCGHRGWLQRAAAGKSRALADFKKGVDIQALPDHLPTPSTT